MLLRLRLVWSCCLLACALPALAQVPKEADFYRAIGITVATGEQAQFVAGDNIAGYLDCVTHAAQCGAGYTIRREQVWRGYRSYHGQRALPRSEAQETILPYGHLTRYASGEGEEMALLSKQQAVAMRLHAPQAGLLALAPLLPATAAAQDLQRIGAAWVIAPAQPKGLWTALAADQPALLTQQDGVWRWRSARPVRSFTLVAAFADSAAAAAARALALAAADAIARERSLRYARLTASLLWTDDARYNRALAWSKAASEVFVVEEFGAGIWAGLPWFRDNWGRDTFIALPGTLLVSGQFATARAVLRNFARYQNLRDPQDKDYGRIPNRVAADTRTIYNTVDGTPWMLREALEYLRYTGDRAFAADMLQLARAYIDGVQRHGLDADGLLTHDDADTWMDARIEGKQPWSARGPRAVEIQALWYTALQSGATLADFAGDPASAAQWRAMARRAQASFMRLFWDGAHMADRLRADGSRDTKLRPNQLMLATIPFDDFIPPDVAARVTRNAVQGLLYPYGIASLSEDDPAFHPRHENPAFHHKDAAYHQGTVWGWNAGFTVTALTRFGYQELAYALAGNLATQMLTQGTRGNMSELLDALPDAQGQARPSGTFAQSWSVAEYARNGYQDFLGFRPDLLANTLAFVPALPQAWQRFDARLPFGSDEQLLVQFHRTPAGEHWSLHLQGSTARTLRMDFLAPDQHRARLQMVLQPGQRIRLRLHEGQAWVDGRVSATQVVQDSYAGLMGALQFRQPRPYREADFPVLRGVDVLKGVIESGAYR